MQSPVPTDAAALLCAPQVNECAIPPQFALGFGRLVSSEVLHGAVYRVIASRFTSTAAEMPALLDRYRWPEPERTRVLQLLLGCLDAMRTLRAEVDAAVAESGGVGVASAPDADEQPRPPPSVVRTMMRLRNASSSLGL